MRLLFLGDTAATGFGTVTYSLGSELVRLGVDCRFLSMNETEEQAPEPIGSRTIRVGGETGDGWLAQYFRILPYLTGQPAEDGWVADALLVLGDYGSIRYGITRMDPAVTEAFRRMPSFHYVPIEGIGLPPSWRDLWEIVEPIAMTQFGADQIEGVIGRRPEVVYHGVDTNVFRPIRPDRPLRLADGTFLRSKADARRIFGGNPDDVWVLRTDRNMPRKRFPSMFRIMAPLLAANPRLRLILHCRTIDEGGNVADEAAKLSREVQSRILLTGFHDRGQALPREDLAVLYNAADLYLSTGAEGFGLTVAEAIACGTPAVALDYSSLPEVVGPAGVLVPPAYLVDNEYDHYWAAMNEDRAGEEIARLIASRNARERLGRQGPAWVRDHFQWRLAAAQFAAVIEQRIAARRVAA
jgi:glycosyltransferase involved in cell wall biosynthesis